MADQNESDQFGEGTEPLEDEEIIELTDIVSSSAEDDEAVEAGDTPDIDEALSLEYAIDEDVDMAEDEDDFAESLGMDLEEESAVSEPISVSTEQLEETLERVIERMLSEKIERIIEEAIERSVTKELERLKGILLEDSAKDE